MEHDVSAQYDHADYDAFVRGIQSTSVTPSGPPGKTAGIAVRTVCPSTVEVANTATPFSVDRRTSERRSIGGKLIRTLRKTFSLASLSAYDEVEEGGLSEETTGHTSSSLGKRASIMLPLSTPSVDNGQSMQPTENDTNKLEWQELKVR